MEDLEQDLVLGYTKYYMGLEKNCLKTVKDNGIDVSDGSYERGIKSIYGFNWEDENLVGNGYDTFYHTKIHSYGFSRKTMYGRINISDRPLRRVYDVKSVPVKEFLPLRIRSTNLLNNKKTKISLNEKFR